MIPSKTIEELIEKHSALEKELSSGEIDKKLFAERSKEYSDINEIIDVAKKHISFENDKQELEKINNSFIKDDLKQSRIITAELRLKKKKIELINIYVPNGNPVDTEKYEYKKEWLKKFISSVKKKIQKNSNMLIAGDFNIIPEEIDVHDFKRYENDALGRLEIRKKYRELINLGFKDVYRFKNKSKQEYTFWDYFAGSWQKNYGMRIDHFLISNSLIENIKSININKKPRSKEKPSDHTPIELEII